MSESEKSNLDHLPSRRVFVKTSTAAAVGLLGAWGAKPAETAAQEPPVVALTKEARDQMTADQILEKWKEGNRRFREGRKIQRDFLAEQQATASGQFPAGVLLGCIDSRAPAEILFNLGMGDIFNARIAATSRTPTSSAAWSSPRSSPAKVVLVMGHSACGAVAGAIADAKLGNLTQLLMKIQPAIKATEYTGARTPDNAEFVDAVARKNVELTMANIRKNSQVIAELEKAGAVKIAGAFYNLKTGAVEFFA